MRIRKTAESDIGAVLRIYENARRFMRKTGNLNQWTGGYPGEDVLRRDIGEGRSYVCEEDGEILGTFYFMEDTEPTYLKIYGGSWKNEEPYGVVHRIAVSERGRGVAAFCLDWCFEKCRNLRIDTHRDNYPMRRALEKNGFSYCGVIHLANGDERLAYQKTRDNGS